METKETSAVKHSMKFGAYVGSALILFSLVLYAIGLNQNEFQFPTYIIMIVGLFSGIRQYRDTVSEGFISYAKSLKIGLAISFFSAFIIGFYAYIFFQYIDVSQLDAMLEQIRIQMVNQGKTEEELDLVMPFIEKFVTPGGMFLSDLFGYTFFGFIFSLVIAAFVKKDKDLISFDSQENI